MSREPSATDADSRVALSAPRAADTPPPSARRPEPSTAWVVQQYAQPAHHDAILCSASLQVGPRLLVFTASADGELRVWGCSGTAALQLEASLPLGSGARALAASGPSLFAGLGSGEVLHLDLRPLLSEGKPSRPTPLFSADSPPRYLAVAGGSLVVQAQSSSVYVYDLHYRSLASTTDLSSVSAGSPDPSLAGISGYYPHEAVSASLRGEDVLLSALTRGALAMLDLRQGKVFREISLSRPPTQVLDLGSLDLEGSFLTGHVDEVLARWDARMTSKPLDTSNAGAVPLCMRPISDVWTRRCEPDWPTEDDDIIHLARCPDAESPAVEDSLETSASALTVSQATTTHHRTLTDPESSAAVSHRSASAQPEPRRWEDSPEHEGHHGHSRKYVAVGLSNGASKIYDVEVMGHSRVRCRAEGDMGVSQQGGITCVEWLTHHGLLTGGQDCGLFVYQ